MLIWLYYLVTQEQINKDTKLQKFYTSAYESYNMMQLQYDLKSMKFILSMKVCIAKPTAKFQGLP